MARKVKRQIKSKPKVPGFAKFISVLGFIGSAVTLILGVLFLVGSAFIQDLASLDENIQPQELAAISTFGPGLLIFLGILLVGFAILNFFVARGLWKGHNWARIFTIIMLAIGALSALAKLFSGKFDNIVILVIDVLLIWYFGFNKKVVKAYS